MLGSRWLTKRRTTTDTSLAVDNLYFNNKGLSLFQLVAFLSREAECILNCSNLLEVEVGKKLCRLRVMPSRTGLQDVRPRSRRENPFDSFCERFFQQCSNCFQDYRASDHCIRRWRRRVDPEDISEKVRAKWHLKSDNMEIVAFAIAQW
ncbi:hypothetical protein J6590_046357 [Homalodisca vitripennis]|nr:hypothetical protein J6590_046357 [Homalodisca vitripennis]